LVQAGRIVPTVLGRVACLADFEGDFRNRGERSIASLAVQELYAAAQIAFAEEM